MTRPSDVGESQQARMRNTYDDHLAVVEQLLARERWDIDGIDAAPKEYLRTVQKLSGAGVIVCEDVRRRDSRDGGQDRVNVWVWAGGCREWLCEYVERRNELPCRHRAHIHTSPDGRLGCRFCDEPREFSRAEVSEAMGQ